MTANAAEPRNGAHMRPTSLILAALVMVTLYALVFERERLMGFAAGDTDAFADMGEPEAGAVAVVEEAAEPAAADPAVTVVVVDSVAQPIERAVLLRGQTEAARSVEVRSETSGLVVSDPLRKGARVETGDLLCELDPGTRLVSLAEAQARLEEARARLPEAEARVREAEARAREAEARVREAEIEQNAASRLSEGGFASDARVAGADAQIEAAQAQVETAQSGIESARAGVQGAESGIQSAEAGVAAAEREIERLRINAPFGGLLESDTAELGSLLQAGALCGTIIQLDPVKLVGFVPEAEVDRIAEGARVGGRLATGREVQGTVSFLSRSADTTTRTFRVEAEVPNADLSIRDGQTVEMIIEAEGAEAHLVPQSALTLDDDGHLGVRMVVDGITEFAAVSILRDGREGVWVSGPPDEARIIVVGQEFVTDGVAVEASLRESGQ